MPLQNLLKQRDDLNLTDWRDDSVIEKWKSEFNWSYESCRNDLYSSDSQYWVIILVLSTVASYGLLQNIFLLVLLSRVNRIEKSIKIFLVFETVSKIVLIVSNCLQLNQFSCMSKQNIFSRWIDEAFGMECSGAWLMTNLSNIGMTGLTVFSMLSGLFRVSMLNGNTPGTKWSMKKVNFSVAIGLLAIVGHLSMIVQASPFRHPFYRSCVIPAKSSFMFTLDRTTKHPSDKLVNIHLILMFSYNLVTFICNLIVACLMRKRARQIQEGKSTNDFKEDFQNYSKQVQCVGIAQSMVFFVYLSVYRLMQGYSNHIHAIFLNFILTFLWGVLNPSITFWGTADLRNAGIEFTTEYIILPILTLVISTFNSENSVISSEDKSDEKNESQSQVPISNLHNIDDKCSNMDQAHKSPSTSKQNSKIWKSSAPGLSKEALDSIQEGTEEMDYVPQSDAVKSKHLSGSIRSTELRRSSTIGEMMTNWRTFNAPKKRYVDPVYSIPDFTTCSFENHIP